MSFIYSVMTLLGLYGFVSMIPNDIFSVEWWLTVLFSALFLSGVQGLIRTGIKDDR